MTISDGAPPQAAEPDDAAAARDRHARALSRRQGRNNMFGILLAVISLGLFALVVGLVVVFHALEAYRVIPGF